MRRSSSYPAQVPHQTKPQASGSMIGYPPSPAVMATHPPPPLSPADKIPTSKEHELFTIDALNTRLRSLLDRDKKENVELERKRNEAKEACAKAKEDLDMISWAFSQGCSDLQTQKETWASTEADVITNELTNADRVKLVNHLRTHKNDFTTDLAGMVAKKQQKLALLESKLKEISSYETAHETYISELTATMRGQSDSLKKKMVECVRLGSSIRKLQDQKRIETYHEKRWAERCAPYEGLDPATYAANKEAERIRSREAELEARFKKIYEDTVAQMTEQSETDQNSAAEKKRQYDVEKLNLESQTKELRSKRVHLVNEVNSLETDLRKTNKQIQELEVQILELEQQIPNSELAMVEVLEKLKEAETAMQAFATKAQARDNQLAILRAALKEKQDQAAKAKIEEDNKINDLKERLQEKRQRLEEANIGLFPEISKYRGLVDVAEVKLTPRKKQKRTTM